MMVQENYTDITFVLDKSGSMCDCVTDTLGGLNSFINEQKGVEGKCRVSVHMFDTMHYHLFEATPISELPELTTEHYKTNGGTALLDALGSAINSAGARFARMPENKRPAKVLFVVLTDGEENSSRRFTKEQVGAMISDQENTYDWDFTFLGADFDAIGGYGGLVSKAGRSANYGKEETTSAFINFSQNVTKYRGSIGEAKNSISLTDGIGDNQ